MPAVAKAGIQPSPPMSVLSRRTVVPARQRNQPSIVAFAPSSLPGIASSPLAPSKLAEVFLSGPSTPGWPST